MITYVCPHCGSDDVVVDAFASWDPIQEDWVLHSVYDYAECLTCGEDDIRIHEVPYHEA